MPVHYITKFAVFLVLCLAVIPAGPAQADTLSKADVEGIIKTFLKDNPEVILESLEQYRRKQQEDIQARTEQKIKDNLAKLTDGSAPEIGNKNGDVTVVEFFDYNCGYCKRALPDIQEVVENDKNVRIIFKEMPILSPESELAAKWALAAHKQDRYFDYHAALMKHRGPKNEKTLTKIGKDLKLDVRQLKNDAGSAEIAKTLEEERMMAAELGVRGTPAFIINGKFFPGYLGPDGLLDAVKDARAGTS